MVPLMLPPAPSIPGDPREPPPNAGPSSSLVLLAQLRHGLERINENPGGQLPSLAGPSGASPRRSLSGGQRSNSTGSHPSNRAPAHDSPLRPTRSRASIPRQIRSTSGKTQTQTGQVGRPGSRRTLTPQARRPSHEHQSHHSTLAAPSLTSPTCRRMHDAWAGFKAKAKECSCFSRDRP